MPDADPDAYDLRLLNARELRSVQRAQKPPLEPKPEEHMPVMRENTIPGRPVNVWRG